MLWYMHIRFITIFVFLFHKAFITTRIHDKAASYWIGLNDINGDGSYDWIDNSPVVYTHWDQYAPRSNSYTRVMFFLLP